MNTEIIDFFKFIYNSYQSMLSGIPLFFRDFLNFFFLVLIVVIYSIFVWNLYRFISKKNPLGLNLNQYNKFENSFLSRLTTATLYFIEYVLLLPFLIFFIFCIFTFFLIILSKSDDVLQIITISATVIAAIRITAYYKEALSQEISKLLPFTLLAVSVLNPYSFASSQYIDRVVSHFIKLPSLIEKIMYFLVFIIILEIGLLFIDFIFSLFNPKDSEMNIEE